MHSLLGHHISGPVAGGRSDPTTGTEEFNHKDILVKLEDSTKGGIPTSDTLDHHRDVCPSWQCWSPVRTLSVAPCGVTWDFSPKQLWV